MFIRAILIIVLFPTLFTSVGQQSGIDTLESYFNKLPDNGDKVKEMALKGHSLARTDPEYAISLGQRAIQLAKRLNEAEKLGSAHNAIGYAFIINGQQDSAEWHYNKAIEIAKELSDSTLISQSYLNLSTILRRKGEYEKGINYLFNAQRIYEARGDSSSMASVMVNIGIFHSIQKNFTESIRYYRQAAKIRVAMGQENRLGNVYNNLGIDNELNGNMDSALYFYGKSLETRIANNQLADVSASYNNLSVFFRTMNQPDSSLYLAEKAFDIGKRIKSKRAQFQALRSMSNALIDLGRYREAEKNLTQCLEIAGTNAGATSLASIYESLYSVKEKQGQYRQALEYHKEYKALSDSANSVNKIAAIKDAEEKFESEKKDKQITKLELEQKTAALALARSSNERNVLIAFLSIITIAAGLLFIVFRQKRKSLAEKELLLKEIHHRVKNNLQVISSLLNLQADSLGSKDAKDAVMEGQHRVKSMALIHQKLYSTDDVRGVDLQDYLENLSSELFKAFGIDQEKINWEVKTSGLKLDIDTVIPLGLIINELITNALKYAFKEVDQGLLQIEMMQEGENLSVLIKDNGIGMNAEQIEKSNSFGWRMIKSLCRKLKAEIAINNDDGTQVSLILSRFKLVT